MKGYGQITNPVTGRKVSVRGATGQSVLRSYLQNAQSGGARRSRTRRSRTRRSRSPARRQRGGAGMREREKPVDNLMHDLPYNRVPVLDINGLAANRHQKLQEMHGNAVRSNIDNTEKSNFGYHWPGGTPLTRENGADKFGATPTSLVCAKVVKQAVDGTPGRRAASDLTISSPGTRGGVLVTRHVKKGAPMKTHYPPHINAMYMAGYLQSGLKNNTSEDIRFVCLDIDHAAAPPSHVVEVGRLQNISTGDLNDSDLSPDQQAVLKEMVKEMTNAKGSLWRKISRDPENNGLLDYHGLKISVRGMLFDFVMGPDTIRFAIDKSLGRDTDVRPVRGEGSAAKQQPPRRGRLPNAKCMVNVDNHLHGEIKYTLSGSGAKPKITLDSCKLQQASHGCWPPKRVNMDLGHAMQTRGN